MVNGPTTFANKFFAEGFIHSQTKNDVSSEPSHLAAHKVTQECCQYISLHPDPEAKLNEMLDVLEMLGELPGHVVAKRIREVSMQDWYIHDALQPLSLSLSLSLLVSLSAFLLSCYSLVSRQCLRTLPAYEIVDPSLPKGFTAFMIAIIVIVADWESQLTPELQQKRVLCRACWVFQVCSVIADTSTFPFL